MGHIQRHQLTSASVAVAPPHMTAPSNIPMRLIVTQCVAKAHHTHTLAELRSALLLNLNSGNLRTL